MAIYFLLSFKCILVINYNLKTNFRSMSISTYKIIDKSVFKHIIRHLRSTTVILTTDHTTNYIIEITFNINNIGNLTSNYVRFHPNSTFSEDQRLRLPISWDIEDGFSKIATSVVATLIVSGLMTYGWLGPGI